MARRPTTWLLPGHARPPSKTNSSALYHHNNAHNWWPFVGLDPATLCHHNNDQSFSSLGLNPKRYFAISSLTDACSLLQTCYVPRMAGAARGCGSINTVVKEIGTVVVSVRQLLKLHHFYFHTFKLPTQQLNSGERVCRTPHLATVWPHCRSHPTMLSYFNAMRVSTVHARLTSK